MICPEETIIDIWKEYKLHSRQQRSEYGVDDLAISMKAAVADWAYNNIRAPVGTFCRIRMGLIRVLQVRLLFGVIFCTDGEAQHTYNWSLDQSLSSVVFFKPQSGRITIIPEYANYFGVY
jgi:Agglutinin C-terminal